MSNQKINIMIAIVRKAEEDLLRQSVGQIRDFSLSYLPVGYQLSDVDYSGLDIVISCNTTLNRNPSFNFKTHKPRKPQISTYVALYRRHLHRSTENLSRVNGCILLDGNLKLIGNAMRLANKGYSVFPSKLNDIFIDFGHEETWIHNLQLDECLILNEMAHGSNDKEIARQLNLGGASFQNEKTELSKKLRVMKPSELKYFALRHKEALHDQRRQLIHKTNITDHDTPLQIRRSGK